MTQTQTDADTETWQPNQSLPGGYRWGYAGRSRYRAMAGPVVEHVVVGVVGTDPGEFGEMLCSGGFGITGTGGGKHCPECVAQVRAQLSDD